ncbi:MAG: TolC family protein [Tannerellaceae bacterium]|nr:TolC family protein [Tannerellaceae bacterium]
MMHPVINLAGANHAEIVVLTLEDALRVGMSESPTVKVADKEVEKKRYGHKGAYAALFPQLNFGADYSRTLKKQVMYMDGAFDMTAMMMPTFNGIEKTFQGVSTDYQQGTLMENIMEATPVAEDSGNDGISVGRDNNWSFGFTGGMPLINVALWKSLSISAADVELAVEQARSSRIELVNQVKRAFYGVMLAEDSYRVLKESYDHAQANYEDIVRKYEQGVVAEYDMIRAEVAVRNVEPNVLQASNAVVLSKWQLKVLIGVDLEVEVVCEGKLTDYENKLFEGCLWAVDTSLEDNSSLRQLAMQGLMLKRTLSMQKADFLPTVSLSGAYNWSAMNNDFKFKEYLWNPFSTVALSLSFPLFQGGGRVQKINQTRVSLQQLEIQRENIARNLKLAVKQYKDNMETCVKRYQAARRGVEQAEKGRMIARKRYETGGGALLELNDAELALTQAKLGFNQAIYDFVVTEAEMEKAKGIVGEIKR